MRLLIQQFRDKVKPVQIEYRVTLKDATLEIIDLHLDPETLSVINRSVEDLPPWTRLDYYQCPHCPLDISTNPHCPVAVSLVDIVNRFNRVASYDEVDVEVITSDRTTTRSTTSQKAVSSLFGLLIATSGCPHTTFLKPMARFHLPMSKPGGNHLPRDRHVSARPVLYPEGGKDT